MSVVDDLRTLAPPQSYRERSNPNALWRASMLGYCPRLQILAAKGINQKHPDSLLRKFSVHSGAHDAVQDWVFKCLSDKYEVMLEEKIFDPDTRAGGHIDAIVVDENIAYVAEIKTYAFLRGDPKEDSYWQHQISFYYNTVFEQGRWPLVQPLVMIVTLDGNIKVVEPKVTDEYASILFNLNLAWDSDTLPDYRDCRTDACSKCNLQRICTEPISSINEYAELVTARSLED